MKLYEDNALTTRKLVIVIVACRALPTIMESDGVDWEEHHARETLEQCVLVRATLGLFLSS